MNRLMPVHACIRFRKIHLSLNAVARLPRHYQPYYAPRRRLLRNGSRVWSGFFCPGQPPVGLMITKMCTPFRI